MEGILLIVGLLGIPLIIYIGAVAAGSAVAKPIMRAQHVKEVERDMRHEVAEANLRQQVARKLLNEYDR